MLRDLNKPIIFRLQFKVSFYQADCVKKRSCKCFLSNILTVYNSDKIPTLGFGGEGRINNSIRLLGAGGIVEKG